MTKIIEKINQIHCEIYSDPTGQGGQLAARLQYKAVKLILDGPGDGKANLKDYMSEFASDDKQLSRLMGEDPVFNNNPWARQTLAYLVANSTCGIATGTGTRNNMTDDMVDSLDA